MNIKEETIAKFSIADHYQVLDGGQGESVKAGQIVLKPVHNKEEYKWVSKVLNGVNFSDLNVAKPILSLNGNYIEDGIGATRYFNHRSHLYDVNRNLSLCRRLNQVLKDIPKPADLFDNPDNPWKKANFLAWKGENDEKFPKEIQFLLSLRIDTDLPIQLIHVDLGGNILVNEHDETCIIDFTPGFYPKEYAEAILIIDSISWYKSPLDVINEIKINKSVAFQLILRALIFRMSVPLFSDSSIGTLKAFYEQLAFFRKVYSYFEDK